MGIDIIPVLTYNKTTMQDLEYETIDAILKGINSTIKGKNFYPSGHPAIAVSITKTYQTLSEALNIKKKLFIGIVKDVLLFEENPIIDAEKNLSEFVGRMNERQIEGLLFEKGLAHKEFSDFIDILSGENISKGKEFQQILTNNNISHITIKSLQKNILEIYQEAISVVKKTMDEIRLGKVPKTLDIATKVVSKMTEFVLLDKSAMLGLTMIKNYDNYLFNHCVNVSILSITLAQSMKHEKDDLQIVGVAGLLHDVGKVGISENIIKKSGTLSTQEWEAIKQHPVLGAKIIEQMKGMREIVGQLIYEHHIRYDHSGYPYIKSPLHPLSLIITIADAYDALTTLRVYQMPYHPIDAIKVMNSLSGKHFDPNTLKAFIAMLGVYPIGTLVRLSTNEVGIVTKINPANAVAPIVKIIFGADGKQVDRPYEIDLSENSNSALPCIVAPIDPLIKGLDMGAFFEGEAKN